MLNPRYDKQGERMKQQSGVTLIEAMITLSVLAILIGIAAPSFRDTIRLNRTAAVTNDLVAALQYARSEAIRRGIAIQVCAGNDVTVCNGSWLNGWYVTLDPTDADAVLRVWPAPPAGVQISGGATLTFGPMGASSTTVTFSIQYAGCTGTGARSVQVNPMGRVSTEAVTCT